MAHIPVLLNEAIKILEPERGRAFIDATADGGGHTEEILKRMNANAILVAVDRDESAIERLKNRFFGDSRLKLVVGNFRNLKSLAKNFSKVYDGIIFDLGMSSDQLNPPAGGSGRGFSFKKDEPLLMTYETKPGPNQLTAASVINSWPEEKLAEILKDYGEERHARRIAKAIVEERRRLKILSTLRLAEIVSRAVPALYRRNKLHPATRTFQALRIAVNDELGTLEEGLDGAWQIIAIGGRIAVISFHSLEDRIVKNFFRDKKSKGEAKILTKKPLRSADEEVKINPRSRSAKLRAIIKLRNV
ncbi:MAG: 16S rRNA (cytosine(1402)-N(4))-methyltransferase RsmH [Patescibacteria group bacterium]